MAKASWVFRTFDPAGEVIFAAARILTRPVFTGLPNINRAYF
jgi:hypothetical protein